MTRCRVETRGGKREAGLANVLILALGIAVAFVACGEIQDREDSACLNVLATDSRVVDSPDEAVGTAADMYAQPLRVADPLPVTVSSHPVGTSTTSEPDSRQVQITYGEDSPERPVTTVRYSSKPYCIANEKGDESTRTIDAVAVSIWRQQTILDEPLFESWKAQFSLDGAVVEVTTSWEIDRKPERADAERALELWASSIIRSELVVQPGRV